MWRLPVPVLLGLGLAALLAIGALLALSSPMAWPVGAGTSDLLYMPLAADKSLGVNTDLSRLDQLERQETMAAMEASGVRWLRQRIPWDGIEPRQGAYDWAAWDEIIEDLKRHNLKLVAVLNGSPAWARADEDTDNRQAPPVENRDFGDFAAAFAARYGDWIDYYQVWDEPNIAPHWGAREIDPAAYGRLLREGAIRIRAADPGAVILLAALAPNVESGGANMSDLLFLDALYQQGTAEWFDVVAAQPYAFGEPLDAAPNLEQMNWRRMALLRNVMESHSDEQTAVWAVSSGVTNATSTSIVNAVRQAREEWPWLGPMLWAAWSPDDVHGEYAMVDLARGALADLASVPVVAWPGVYAADHPSANYEGDWRVAPSGADIGGSGDRVKIRFQGTRLDLIVRRGDYRAFLFVTVDGQPANALPRDSGDNAYVVLYDPLQQMDTVTVAQNLPLGEHTAEIVAERGWGQWAIVGWSVYREISRDLPWLAIGLGIASLAVLSVTAYEIWHYRRVVGDAMFTVVARYRAVDERLILVTTAGAAILVYLMVGTIPTLGALAVLSLLLMLRPEMGLPLIALALPFYQLGRPLLGKVFSMVEILTLLTALGWSVNRLCRRRGFGVRIANGEWRMTALDWGVLALVVVGALSLFWADHAQVAAREFRTVVLEAGIFYALLRVMVPIQPGMGHEMRDLWRVTDAWVLGGALIALVGLFQFAFGQNLITAEGVWRVRGFYGSPNNLALYLGRVFPMVVGMAAWGQRGWRRWAYGLAALLIAFAIFLTYSRGAWLVGVPVSLLCLAAMRGRRTLLAGIGLFLVVALIVLVAVGVGRLTSLLDTTEGTTFFRLQLWQSSLAMIRDHPLLGVGLDNFLYYYRTEYVLPTAWEEFNLSHPHNLIFDYWLRLGVLGLVTLLWMLVAFFRRGWQTYRRLPESDMRVLVLGLMAGMINFVAHGLVDNAFFLVDLAFTFMLMLALVQVANNDAQVVNNG
jgi:putative inorganic carbon (HCO3(-)) transporter